MIPKFRAWDKLKNEMYVVEQINFNRGEFESIGYGITFLRGADEVKLMQSTGICDQESTEVFEGDILHHQIQKEYTFIVKHDKDKGRWYGDGLSRTYRIDITKEFLQYYKVIGNIYENPELLEDKE